MERLRGFPERVVAALSDPPRSAHALLAGTLLLRHFPTRFASRVPIWRLPVSGHAAGLVWLLQIFGPLVVVGPRLVLRRFAGLVVPDQAGIEFD